MSEIESLINEFNDMCGEPETEMGTLAQNELKQLLDTKEMWQERSAGYALEVVKYREREKLLLSYIRDCLPYVRDMVGIASSARVLEQQIVDLLDERV